MKPSFLHVKINPLKRETAFFNREISILKKILIVEDDTSINHLLKEALTKEGYACDQAFSGTEAGMLLQMNSYALVLLDLMLPGIPGEEVLEQIRKSGTTPVIVLTAKNELQEKVDVLTGGADYTLSLHDALPISAEQTTILQNLLKSKKSLHAYRYSSAICPRLRNRRFFPTKRSP